MYHNILLAVDAVSESVDAAAIKAKAVADSNAKLTVLHVMEPRTIPYSVDPSLSGAMYDALEDNMRRSTREHIESLCRPHGFGEDDIMIIEGRPAATIKRTARDLNCDLVCVASHGRHGWQRLLGSTANAVLHGCCCTVLIGKLASSQ